MAMATQTMDTGDREVLETLLAPIVYSEEVDLPSILPGRPRLPSGGPMFSKGHFSKNCEWGWMYSGSLIRCFPVEEGIHQQLEPLLICTEPYQFPEGWTITSSAELLSRPQAGCSQVSRLLLGLNFRDTTGGLAIFDPMKASPLKFIMIPYPVTCVSIVSHWEGSSFSFFPRALHGMVGVAGVGLQGGDVLLVDLGLDLLPPVPSGVHYKSVFTPKRILHVLPISHNEPDVALTRRESIAKNLVLIVIISNVREGEEEDKLIHFPTHHADGSEGTRNEIRENVEVTALTYLPRIGILAVGFNFAGFQLYNIESLKLLHSAGPPPEAVGGAGVMGFSFSQPIDDPRYFCYIWLMFGRDSLEIGPAHVELYALEFRRKTGTIYRDLKRCMKRLTFRLEDFYDSDPVDRDTSFPPSTLLGARHHVRPLKMWTHPEFSTSLTFFAWESYRDKLYYVGVFDLNEWYSSRMIETLRTDPVTGLCPFWVAIPVEKTDTFGSIPIADVVIVPETLQRWENPDAQLPIHNYPASLSFHAVTLLQSTFSSFQFCGVQEKFIRKLIDGGTRLMLKPSQLKQSFRLYGIRPTFPTRFDVSVQRDVADRFYIFSSLLDNRRPALIMRLAAEWVTGSYANSGCTVDLILQWIACYSTALRAIAKDHWQLLFRSSRECLPPDTIKFVNYSNFAWTALQAVLTSISRPDEVFIPRENYINTLEDGLRRMVQYSAGLLMFFRAELLPQSNEMDILSSLAIMHEERRKNVSKALKSCSYLDEKYQSTPPLMIDYLLEAFDEDFVSREWQRSEYRGSTDTDKHLYPPSHIVHILNMFLWEHDEDPKAIPKIIAYFLLDLRNIMAPQQKEKLRGDFHSVMGLTAAEQAELYHLWLLDHDCLEEALVFMAQPGRLSSTSFPWAAAAVIATALGKEDHVTDILSRGCPDELSSLFINLMSRSLDQHLSIFDTQSFKMLSTDEEFIRTFFEVSDKNGFLPNVVSSRFRCLSSEMVQVLISHLKGKNDFDSGELLLQVLLLTDDLDKLEEEYVRVKSFQERGFLNQEQRSRWTNSERRILAGLRNRHGFARDLADSIKEWKGSGFSTAVMGRSKPTAIQVEAVPLTPQEIRTGAKWRPLCKRLANLKSKSNMVNPLSPLRRYAAKVKTVCDTPASSQRLQREREQNEAKRENSCIDIIPECPGPSQNNKSFASVPSRASPSPIMMMSFMNNDDEEDLFDQPVEKATTRVQTVSPKAESRSKRARSTSVQSSVSGGSDGMMMSFVNNEEDEQVSGQPFVIPQIRVETESPQAKSDISKRARSTSVRSSVSEELMMSVVNNEEEEEKFDQPVEENVKIRVQPESLKKEGGGRSKRARSTSLLSSASEGSEGVMALENSEEEKEISVQPVEKVETESPKAGGRNKRARSASSSSSKVESSVPTKTRAQAKREGKEHSFLDETASTSFAFDTSAASAPSSPSKISSTVKKFRAQTESPNSGRKTRKRPASSSSPSKVESSVPTRTRSHDIKEGMDQSFQGENPGTSFAFETSLAPSSPSKMPSANKKVRAQTESPNSGRKTRKRSTSSSSPSKVESSVRTRTRAQGKREGMEHSFLDDTANASFVLDLDASCAGLSPSKMVSTVKKGRAQTVSPTSGRKTRKRSASSSSPSKVEEPVPTRRRARGKRQGMDHSHLDETAEKSFVLDLEASSTSLSPSKMSSTVKNVRAQTESPESGRRTRNRSASSSSSKVESSVQTRTRSHDKREGMDQSFQGENPGTSFAFETSLAPSSPSKMPSTVKIVRAQTESPESGQRTRNRSASSSSSSKAESSVQRRTKARGKKEGMDHSFLGENAGTNFTFGTSPTPLSPSKTSEKVKVPAQPESPKEEGPRKRARSASSSSSSKVESSVRTRTRAQGKKEGMDHSFIEESTEPSFDFGTSSTASSPSKMPSTARKVRAQTESPNSSGRKTRKRSASASSSSNVASSVRTRTRSQVKKEEMEQSFIDDSAGTSVEKVEISQMRRGQSASPDKKTKRRQPARRKVQGFVPGLPTVVETEGGNNSTFISLFENSSVP